MGTRSTVHFSSSYNEDRKRSKFCSIYRQYDGYPSCVGLELGNFLKEAKGNGLECVAAQYVAKIKTEPYNVYMTYHNNRQEYNYYVNEEYIDMSGVKLSIKVTYQDYKYSNEKDKYVSVYRKLFEGDVDDFIRWCKNEN